MKVVGPLGGKFDFFSPLGFEIQSDFDYRTLKLKFYSVKAFICYLNEKNLIHDRVTATISKFSPQSFETYFNQSESKHWWARTQFLFLQQNNMNLKCLSIEITCVCIHIHQTRITNRDPYCPLQGP